MKTSSFARIRQQTIVTFIALTLGTWLWPGAGFAEESNQAPSYQVVDGETTTTDGWLIAGTESTIEIPMDPEASLLLEGKTGINKVGAGIEGGSIVVWFLDDNGQKALDDDGEVLPPFILYAADKKLGDETFEDAYIYMNWPLEFYVRPNISFYNAERRKELLKSWSSLPAASEHPFRLEFRRVGEIFQIWFDGNFLADLEVPADNFGVHVKLAPGAALREVASRAVKSTPWEVLPVAAAPRPGELADPHLNFDTPATLPPAFQKMSGAVAGISLSGLDRFTDVIGKNGLISLLWSRNTKDQLPEQRMFTVPLDTYSYAYLLCAVEDDAGKSNSFTFRVTRYGRGRGNAMADSIVTVPRGDPESSGDDNVRRVGTVNYGPKDAQKTAALWLIKVPIKNGLIQDLLYDYHQKTDHKGNVYEDTLKRSLYKHLDVELISDPLHNVDAADVFPPPMEKVQRSYWPSPPDYSGYDFYTSFPPAVDSGVHVFAVALEKSPVLMEVKSNIGIRVFYASDKPQFLVDLKAREAGDYAVAWEYVDVDGEVVDHGQKKVTLAAGGAESIIVPVTQGNGWYAARFRLTDGLGQELQDSRTSFVMLPPDTRQAGLESPFYGWWYAKNLNSDIKLDEVGPLLQRLGIRRVELKDDMPESLTLPKYGFTDSTVPWFRKGTRGYQARKNTVAEGVAMHEEFIREKLELWPSIDRLLLFHESGAVAPFPKEIFGETPPPPEAKAVEHWQDRIDYHTAFAQMAREKFPQLKLQYGNDGNSMNLLGELLRQKFPVEYIDTISSESLGQTMAPERNSLDGMADGYYLRVLAAKMGYDVPVTACTEWIGRMTEKLGRRKQAEWKVRDGLLALAYGYDTISIAGMNDASNGYYFSNWANGGLNERYPIMAPKPAYAAVATLTQVLDQAKFRRFVPTGSTVCYLAEFQRGDQLVYALWTPRGNREVTVTFEDPADRLLIDLYGRESSVEGKEPQIKASTSVQYLVSKTPLLNASVGAASFPEDLAKVPAEPLETIPLESLDVINIGSDKTLETQTAANDLGKVIEGNFEIREVNDPEMGACIEVELLPGRELRLGESEYVVLALKKPVTTTAKNAGVWLKGNGSWGEVDILKNHWGPWASNNNIGMRWPGDATMNFEGWNFIMYPFYDWVRTSGLYETTIVSGLRITFPRQNLVGTEMRPIENQKVRIKSIVLF